MKKVQIFLLIGISILSLFLNTFKKNISPPCFTSDEAAFSYNSYSILNTGKDEYGNFLPIRLKSFNDFKMPVYSYLSIPLIKIFGLNENGARALNDLIALLLPAAVFLLAKELFNKNSISLLSSFIISLILGLHIIGRQAHEAYLTVFLTTLSSLFFIRSLKKLSFLNVSLFLVLLLISFFSYQSSRLFGIYFFIYATVFLLSSAAKQINKQKKLLFLTAIIATGFLFLITDLIFSPTRLKNLFIFNNQGIHLITHELRTEGGNRIFYNKASVGLKEILFNHMKYFSPQFLTISGDENKRFGFTGMSPMTPIEYLFIFIGIYYLFKNKEKWKNFIVSLLLISPFSASLSWADLSLTRSLFVFIPIAIICSYGFVWFIKFCKEKRLTYFVYATVFIYFVLLFYSWDFYLNHYPKREIVIRSMQCGYKELVSYVKQNYDKFDSFYITKENGMPYIFFLFYLNYPPEKYQKQAQLSSPDIYGFGQVEKFDKFTFSFSEDIKNGVVIGYPSEFKKLDAEESSRIKKIKSLNGDIFWILEKSNQ
jgi:4-amino-4-deoxy-L-arabinose transferase-like glycosyltransferase